MHVSGHSGTHRTFDNLKVYSFIYMCFSVCAYMYRCLQRPEEGIGSPGAEFPGGCKWCNMNAGP